MALDQRGGPERQYGASAEKAVRERLDLFEHAARVAKLCVYEYDHSTGLRRWSDEVSVVLGLPTGASPTNDTELLSLVHPDDASALVARTMAERVDPTVSTANDKFRIVGLDGQVRHVHLIVHFERDAQGALKGTRGVLFDMTGLHMAETVAAAEEIRFRMAVDAAGMGVYERDHKTGVGKWSDRMWTLFGLEPRAEAPPEAELREMTHPDDLAARQHRARDLLGAPALTVGNLNYRIIRNDGEVRHLVVRSMLDRGPDGTLLAARGIVYDNTEQVVADQVLRASEVRFRNAIEAIGLGVYSFDYATGRGAWSARIWEIFGLPQRDEAPDGDEIDGYVHPDDREARRQAMAQSRSGSSNVARNITYRIIRPDGAIRHVERSEVYERDGDGSIRILLGVLADVTDRVAAEGALRESEARFRNAAAAANLGVFERDPIAGRSFWSERMWEIVGRAPQSAPPSRDEFLTFLHPDDRPRYASVRDVIVQGHARQASGEFRMVRPDATTRYVSIHLLAAPVAATGELHIYGVIADLTEAHELRRRAQISSSLATLGSMAGGIAHDLAQPLTSIGLAAASLEAALQQDAGVLRADLSRRALTLIQQQVDRAGQTISHLLNLARGGQSSGVASLSDIVRGSLQQIGTALREAGVELDISIPEDLPPVQGAQLALEQVLINLLLNARDAMTTANERRIRLKAYQHDDAVILEIEDNGGGIAEAHLASVFEPLFTTKALGKGTGLGLPICRNIMDASGGDITVANGAYGARFTLRFRMS